MKKTIQLAAFTLILILFACKPTDDPSDNSKNLPSSPEAKFTYDNNNGGVVKGVLIGSSGNFKFFLKNGNDSVYCLITFDNVTTKLFPTTNISNWVPGQDLFVTFSGTLGGKQVSVDYVSYANSTTPSMNFKIPGHDISAIFFKEKSTLFVKGYEGTYINYSSANREIDRGTFNCIAKSDNSAFILHRSTTDSDTGSETAYGVITADGKIIVDGTYTFTITDTKISGSSNNKEGEKLVVDGKRTL